MPPLRPPKSLKDLCYEYVVRSIDYYVWCIQTSLNIRVLRPREHISLLQRSYAYLRGPFETLPSSLVSSLIDLLREKNLLRSHHLDVLITSHLEHLDLSDHGDLIPEALNLVSKRCAGRLKSLDLSRCGKIPLETIRNTFPYLTKLQKLSVADTYCCDSLLFILGVSCPDLQELDISMCNAITNRGIAALCEAKDDLGNPNERYGQCRHLRKLIAYLTEIDADGVRLAVENSIHLQVVEYSDNTNSFIQERRVLDPETKQWRTTYVDCNFDTSEQDCDRHTVRNCLMKFCFVTKLELSCCYCLVSEDLASLAQLTQLRNLRIDSFPSEPVDAFPNGVVPILKANTRLECLYLSSFQNVNLEVIACFGRSLSTLGLEKCHYDLEWPRNLKRPRTVLPLSLKKVILRNTSLTEEHVTFLLSYFDLKYLLIDAVSFINNDTFGDFFSRNLLQRLEYIRIAHSSQITFEGVQMILETIKTRKTLYLYECRHITQSHFDLLAKWVRERNWDLDI